MTAHDLGAARQAHSARCRQRVIKALNEAVTAGEEISVSAIARRAGVNRSFLYNHRDLHATVLAKAAEPPSTPTGGPAVSRASLIADLGNAHDRIARLTTENQHLRNRLSEALGEQVWKETGLGGPTDIQQLQRRITELEQQAVELRRQLSDRDNELAAARATNRDLMARLNKSTKGHRNNNDDLPGES
jgi:regulator of replication initiation timing